MTLVTLQLPKKGACPKNWIVRLRDLKFPFKNLPKTSHHNLKLFFKKIQEFVALTGVIILPTHRFAWGNFREIPEKTTHRFATGWNSDQVEFGCSQKQGWAPKMNGENNGFHPICLMADLGGKTHHFRKYPKNQQVSTLPNHGLEPPRKLDPSRFRLFQKKHPILDAGFPSIPPTKAGSTASPPEAVWNRHDTTTVELKGLIDDSKISTSQKLWK